MTLSFVGANYMTGTPPARAVGDRLYAYFPGEPPSAEVVGWTEVATAGSSGRHSLWKRTATNDANDNIVTHPGSPSLGVSSIAAYRDAPDVAHLGNYPERTTPNGGGRSPLPEFDFEGVSPVVVLYSLASSGAVPASVSSWSPAIIQDAAGMDTLAGFRVYWGHADRGVSPFTLNPLVTVGGSAAYWGQVIAATPLNLGDQSMMG